MPLNINIATISPLSILRGIWGRGSWTIEPHFFWGGVWLEGSIHPPTFANATSPTRIFFHCAYPTRGGWRLEWVGGPLRIAPHPTPPSAIGFRRELVARLWLVRSVCRMSRPQVICFHEYSRSGTQLSGCALGHSGQMMGAMNWQFLAQEAFVLVLLLPLLWYTRSP